MKILTYESLDSTNDFLKGSYKDFRNGTVILALNQTKGRGRFDRIWESNEDLTFSILFKMKDHNHHLIAPLAICMSLEKLGYIPKIKWPNDIYINEKKVSGILIECVYEDNKKTCEIIGIGVNLKKKNENLNASYVNHTRNEVLNLILDAYELLLNSSEQELLDEYHKKSYMLNRRIVYQKEIYKIVGFTKNLNLIIENSLETRSITANEIDIKSSIVYE